VSKQKIHVVFDQDLVEILRSLAEAEDRPLSRTVTYYLKEGLKAHGHRTTADPAPPTREEVEAFVEQHPEAQDLLQNFPDEPPPPDEEPPQDIVWWRQGGMER